MPILPAEPDLYPDDLWEREPMLSPALGDEESARWWCLHTKPRQEKATARFLRSRGLAYYLPQVVQEGRTPRGRVTRSVIPLFQGYVFLHGDRHARLESFKGDRLVNVLRVDDQANLDRDLRQIQRMLSSGLPVMAEPSYPVGTPIRITSGPLQGLIGVVDRRQSGDRFIAIVDFLRQGAAVALRDWQVESIAESVWSGPRRGNHEPGR